MNRFIAQWRAPARAISARAVSARAVLVAAVALAAASSLPALAATHRPATAASAAPAAAVEPGAQSLPKTDIAIVTPDGDQKFTVELAVTEQQRETGLMFRQSLAPDAGMLFLYKEPRELSMWMKNTYIPLDMIFIGANGRIVSIRPRAVPHSLTVINSEAPAKEVLELNGGAVDRFGLAVGQEVKGIPDLQ